MNKFLRFYLIIAFWIIFYFIISFLAFSIYLANMIVPIQANNIIKEKCEDNISIFEQIQKVADNVSYHKYKLGVYDCSQFSFALVEQLKAINISAYCVAGVFNNGFIHGLHTWTQLILENKTYNIESTKGEFISDKDYNNNYKVIKKGLCL